MKNKYNKIMENIKVTEEMHDRIIKNIDETDFNTKKRDVIYLARYKKYLSVAACFVFLVTSVVLITNILKSNNNNSKIQVVPDMVVYKTIEELSEAVRFDVTEIDNIPFEVEEVTYTAYWKELAQIIYANKESTIIFRKSVGNEDNSGDYNEYSTNTDIFMNELVITIKGNSGRCNLAIWEKDGYSYSIQSTVGVSEAEMLDMVTSAE